MFSAGVAYSERYLQSESWQNHRLPIFIPLELNTKPHDSFREMGVLNFFHGYLLIWVIAYRMMSEF